jgi:basic membrane protein A and related proteins
MRKLMKYGIWVLLILVTIGIGYNSLKVSAADEKFKVAFLYDGAIGDAGWIYSHDQGRKLLEKELPNVQTTFVESVPENADAERVLTELAEKGNKVIFACSFGYMDYVQKVAAKYPNVVFLHCGGYKTAKNVGTYFGRDYEGRYLSGIVAGKYTKNNLIGFVAAFPIPEVIRGINAFALGAQAVNPKVKVKVVWANTWYDPATEKEAAKSLLSAGADVIGMHMNSPAAMQAAEEKGAYGVAFNSDMRAFAPKAILTAPVWNWGPYYVKAVKAVINGSWKSDQFFGGIADGTIDIGPYGPMVTEDVKKLVTEKRNILLKNDWAVFVGPLKDQSGQVKVKAGQKMSDGEMLSFNWFVQGVEGVLPK